MQAKASRIRSDADLQIAVPPSPVIALLAATLIDRAVRGFVFPIPALVCNSRVHMRSFGRNRCGGLVPWPDPDLRPGGTHGALYYIYPLSSAPAACAMGSLDVGGYPAAIGATGSDGWGS